MQETEVQKALQTYVRDGEPAMGLTTEAVLAAGRRSHRNRRLAVLGAAGVTTALLGVGVATVVGGNSTGPKFAAADPCPTLPGPRPAGAVAADKPFSPEMTKWASTSLTCYLANAMPKLLPNAEYAQVPGIPAGPLLGHSLGGEPPLGQPGGRGPNGETVLLGTEADSTPADAPRNWVVRVYRGHSEIYVQVSNTNRQLVNGGAPVATRPTPVLSADQAIQMALAPELYLFP